MGVANWFSGKLTGTPYDVFFHKVSGQEWQIQANSPAAVEWLKGQAEGHPGVAWMTPGVLLVNNALAPHFAYAVGVVATNGTDFTVGGHSL